MGRKLVVGLALLFLVVLGFACGKGDQSPVEPKEIATFAAKVEGPAAGVIEIVKFDFAPVDGVMVSLMLKAKKAIGDDGIRFNCKTGGGADVKFTIRGPVDEGATCTAVVMLESGEKTLTIVSVAE